METHISNGHSRKPRGTPIRRRGAPILPDGRRCAEDVRIDCHVGGRIKARRQELGMSQETLARGLDLTFQQVQKNESGANRVGASRLWRLAGILRVTPEYFFQGLAR